MRRRLSILFISTFYLITQANDGAFTGSGSNLVPITDSTISVEKEILKVTRVDANYVEVDVYYEFYNEGQQKQLLIGFEAMSASGDVSTLPVNGRHPYISNFTVSVNNQDLDYKVAQVRDSVYYQNGVFNEISKDDYELSDNLQYVDFFYVYHFDCKMKHGLNVIKHTYRQELSSSVAEHYSFDYVLSAANRWKGGVIKDFELILDLGVQQHFSIRKSFFENLSNWSISGNGMILGEHIFHYIDSDWLTVLIDSGQVIYSQTNFEPTSELHLAKFMDWSNPLRFDMKTWNLPDNFNLTKLYPSPIDSISRKILKNYPFALRGYAFKNKVIQEYYELQTWYSVNHTYKATLESLSREEQNWVVEHSK